MLQHCMEQLHRHIPSFSDALSQAVIWPGQDLAGKAEKGWGNGREADAACPTERFLWTIHTRGLTAVGKTHIFSRRCVPIKSTCIFVKAQKSISIGSPVLFRQNNPIQSFRQRPSEKHPIKNPFAPPKPAFKLH